VAIAAIARLLDGVRAPVLRVAIAHSPRLRRAARSRAYRLELFALVGIGGALLGALLAPTLLFVWGPLVLGVPHLAADVRYLALRPYAALRVRARDLVIAVPLIATVWLPTPTVGGLAPLVAIALAPTRRGGRWLLALLTAGSLYAVAMSSPVTALYVMVHAHNVIAIAIAGAILVRGLAGAILVSGAAVGTALILTGALDPLVHTLPLDGVCDYVLPDAARAAWAPMVCARIGLAFVFLQSVHYAAWLRLVPEAMRPRPGMRGFVGGLRALEVDLTRVGVVAVTILAAGLILAGAFDARWARATYLSLASFHAYLELAFLGRWLVGASAR